MEVPGLSFEKTKSRSVSAWHNAEVVLPCLSADRADSPFHEGGYHRVNHYVMAILLHLDRYTTTNIGTIVPKIKGT